MATFTFRFGKTTIKFTEQQNPERIELGERFERIDFVPNNADGSFATMTLGFNPQERTAALNAGARYVFDKPEHKLLHLSSNLNPSRKAGNMGWIHMSGLKSDSTFTTVVINGQRVQVRAPHSRQEGSDLLVFGAQSVWLRLVKVTPSIWDAKNDNTILEATKVGWASLLHDFMSEMVSGTTLTVFPVITKRGEDVFDLSQTKAQWLFATLSSVADGTLSAETATEQYWTDSPFASKRDPVLVEDLKTQADGGTPEPRGVAVVVDGEKVFVNTLAKGVYQPVVAGRTFQTVSVYDFLGRNRLAQMAQKFNGSLALKKVS